MLKYAGALSVGCVIGLVVWFISTLLLSMLLCTIYNGVFAPLFHTQLLDFMPFFAGLVILSVVSGYFKK